MTGAKLAWFTESELSVPFYSKVFWLCPKWKDTLWSPASSGNRLHPSNSDRLLGEDESKGRGDGVSRKTHNGMEMGLAGGVLTYTSSGVPSPVLHKPGWWPSPVLFILRRWRKKDLKLTGIQPAETSQLRRKFEKCSKSLRHYGSAEEQAC